MFNLQIQYVFWCKEKDIYLVQKFKEAVPQLKVKRIMLFEQILLFSQSNPIIYLCTVPDRSAQSLDLYTYNRIAERNLFNIFFKINAKNKSSTNYQHLFQKQTKIQLKMNFILNLGLDNNGKPNILSNNEKENCIQIYRTIFDETKKIARSLKFLWQDRPTHNQQVIKIQQKVSISDYEFLKVQNSDLMKQNINLKNKRNFLQQKVRELKNNLDVQIKNIDNLNQEIEKYKKLYQGIKQEYQNKLYKEVQQSKVLKSQNEALKEFLKNHQNAKKQGDQQNTVKSKNQDSNKIIERLKFQNRKLQNEIQGLNMKISNIDRENKSNIQKNKNLNQELQKASKNITKLEKQIKEIKSENQEKNQNLQMQNQKLMKLDKQNTDKIKVIKKSNEELISQLNSVRTVKQQMENKMKQLKQSLNSEKNEKELIKKQFNSLKSIREQQNLIASEKNSKLTALQSEYSNHLRLLQQYRINQNKYKQQLEKIHQQHNTMADKYCALEQNIISIKYENGKVVQQKSRQNKKLQQQNNSQRSTITSLYQKINQLENKQKYNIQNTYNSDNNNSFKSSSKGNDIKKDQKLIQYQQRIQQLEQQNKRLISQFNEIQSKIKSQKVKKLDNFSKMSNQLLDFQNILKEMIEVEKGPIIKQWIVISDIQINNNLIQQITNEFKKNNICIRSYYYINDWVKFQKDDRILLLNVNLNASYNNSIKDVPFTNIDNSTEQIKNSLKIIEIRMKLQNDASEKRYLYPQQKNIFIIFIQKNYYGNYQLVKGYFNKYHQNFENLLNKLKQQQPQQ